MWTTPSVAVTSAFVTLASFTSRDFPLWILKSQKWPSKVERRLPDSTEEYSGFVKMWFFRKRFKKEENILNGCQCFEALLSVVLCCAVLYCAVLCCAVLCCAVQYCAVHCCALLCCALLCCAVLSCTLLCWALLCCALLCCAVLCCAVPCRAVVIVLYYVLLHCITVCKLACVPPDISRCSAVYQDGHVV